MSGQASSARFAHDAVWERQVDSPWSRLRVRSLLAALPKAPASALDVGCGDGQLLRALRAAFPACRLAGLDRGRPGLARARGSGLAAVAGDADHLPFPDRAFDLVSCTEVLEHLPEPLLGAAAREIGRVGRNMLLISVPNREDLLRERMKCDACGTFFNAFGHLHSFDADKLDALFPAWRRVHTDYAGPRRPMSAALLAAKHRLGRYGYDPTALCPSCGAREFRDWSRDPLSVAFDALNVLRHPTKSGRYWLVTRYEAR